MKIKTILGVIACAGACASFSAFANTTTNWFSVTTSPTAAKVNVTVTNSTGVVSEISSIVDVESGKIALDNDEETPLVFIPGGDIEPDVQPATSDGLVIITATAELTPSSTNDLVEITDAKAGFAVGIDENNVSNFFGYANGVWTKLTAENKTPDTVKVDGETTFSIELDYRTNKVKYYLGERETLLEAAVGGASEFSIGTGSLSLKSVDAWGTGSIASVGTVCEVAVAIGKDGNKYGSVVEAVNTTGEGSIQVVDSATGGAADQQLAANGLEKWKCEILNIDEDNANAVIQLEPAGSDAQNVNLALADDPVDGVTVTFDVVNVANNTTVRQACNKNAIQIPVGTGKYKVVPKVNGN